MTPSYHAYLALKNRRGSNLHNIFQYFPLTSGIPFTKTPFFKNVLYLIFTKPNIILLSIIHHFIFSDERFFNGKRKHQATENQRTNLYQKKKKRKKESNKVRRRDERKWREARPTESEERSLTLLAFFPFFEKDGEHPFYHWLRRSFLIKHPQAPQ